jgi:hypothetical protein
LAHLELCSADVIALLKAVVLQAAALVRQVCRLLVRVTAQLLHSWSLQLLHAGLV